MPEPHTASTEPNLHSFSAALADVVASAAPSVVQVPRRRGGGTGLVVGDDLVVTSAFHAGRVDHVVVANASGEVEHRAATVVGRDPGTDLALLRIDGAALRPIRWATSPARVGQLALALGRPGNAIRASLRSVGVIGPAFRSAWGGRIDAYVETDRAIARGFAGGPLLDTDGAALGMNTRTLVRGADLVVPAATIQRVIAALLTDGAVRHGVLGVSVVPAEVGGEVGALVAAVAPDSPAAKAGIVVGDVILRLAEEITAGPAGLRAALWDRPGEQVTLTLRRGGAPLSLEVTLGSRE